MSRDGEFEKKYPDREGQERAMRLMEALSGVDERLLERCGRERKTRPLWRNMRAVAAAACLAATPSRLPRLAAPLAAASRQS